MFLRRATHLHKAAGACTTVSSCVVASASAPFSAQAAKHSKPVKRFRPVPIAPHVSRPSARPLKGLPKHFEAKPLPGPGYIDAQGPTDTPGEEQGRTFTNWSCDEPYIAQRQALGPTKKLPKRVPSNDRDTLFTYSRRVYAASLRVMRSMYRRQAAHRAALVQEIAQHEYDAIQAKTKAYREWKASQTLVHQRREAAHVQRRAADRLARLLEGNAGREANEKKVLERRVKSLTTLLEESESWVSDPLELKNALFENVVSVPVGWWPVPKTDLDMTASTYDPRSNLTEDDIQYLRTVKDISIPNVIGPDGKPYLENDRSTQADANPLADFLTNSEDERSYFDSKPVKFAPRAATRPEYREELPTTEAKFRK